MKRIHAKILALAAIAVMTCACLLSIGIIRRVRSARRNQSQNVTGTTRRTLQVGSTARSYLLHVPTSYNKSTPVPIILVFHGGESQPQQMESYTGFSALSDREGFIVVYPEGTDKHWNDGRENGPPTDDVEFTKAVIDDVTRSYNVDRKRVYATGISNGGMFSQRLACELSEAIAAVASVAATMPETLWLTCKPSKTISVLVIHGTEDPLIPYGGGRLTRTRMGGNVLSAPDVIKFWATHNKCSSPSVVQLADRDPNDGTHIRQERYRRCANGVQVELDTIVGGGHTLPGSRQYLPELLIGRTSKDIDGTEFIWSFFQATK